jgi:hypothetical protein
MSLVGCKNATKVKLLLEVFLAMPEVRFRKRHNFLLKWLLVLNLLREVRE